MKGLICVGRTSHLWAPALGYFEEVFKASLKGLPCPAESWGPSAWRLGVSPCPAPQITACPTPAARTAEQPWLSPGPGQVAAIPLETPPCSGKGRSNQRNTGSLCPGHPSPVIAAHDASSCPPACMAEGWRVLGDSPNRETVGVEWHPRSQLDVGNVWCLLLSLVSLLFSCLLCRDLPTRQRSSRRLTTGRTTSG